jgi:hypothetical protein
VTWVTSFAGIGIEDSHLPFSISSAHLHTFTPSDTTNIYQAASIHQITTMLFIQILFVCLLTATSLAHPGHNVAEEAAERADYFKRNPKTLSKCASNLQARSSEDITRRHGLANSLRAGRGLATLQARDFTKYDYSHLVANPGPNVFAQNSSCILQPDVTAGPYLVTAESFRSNVVDGQQGVPLALEVRVMDTSTCEPVSGINLDLWHTNATGVYSGLQAGGNGNSGDATNLMNTAFRGIQKTNSNGVVQFETMFPGHYTSKHPQAKYARQH